MRILQLIQRGLANFIASAYHNWGETYNERGQHQDALRVCERALALNARDCHAHYQRGIAYVGLRQIDRALLEFNKALELADSAWQVVEIHIWRGLALYHAADYPDAISEFNLALHLQKTHSMVYVYRGMAEQGQGNLSAAQADFTQAIRHDQANFIAYRHRGDVYAKRNNIRQAIADYRAYLTLSGGHNTRQAEIVRQEITELSRRTA